MPAADRRPVQYDWPVRWYFRRGWLSLEEVDLCTSVSASPQTLRQRHAKHPPNFAMQNSLTHSTGSPANYKRPRFRGWNGPDSYILFPLGRWDAHQRSDTRCCISGSQELPVVLQDVALLLHYPMVISENSFRFCVTLLCTVGMTGAMI